MHSIQAPNSNYVCIRELYKKIYKCKLHSFKSPPPHLFYQFQISQLDLTGAETILGGLLVRGWALERLFHIFIDDNTIGKGGINDRIREIGEPLAGRQAKVLNAVVAEGDVVGADSHGKVKAEEDADGYGNDDAGSNAIIVAQAGVHVKLRVHLWLGEELPADIMTDGEDKYGEKNGEGEGEGELYERVGGEDLDETRVPTQDTDETSYRGQPGNVGE